MTSRTAHPIAAILLGSVLGLGLAADTATAAADSDPIDAELDARLAGELSTADQLTAIDHASRRWDSRMNQIYRQLQAALPPTTAASLRQSQRRWLAFRDSELAALAALYADTEGSLFQPMQAGDRLRLVRERARQLRSWLDTWQLRAQ